MIAAKLLIFVLSGTLATSAGTLPPAASAHNDRALAHLESGEYAEAVDELELAYALLPDPLRDRAARGDIVGSMRSALNSLHAATGDPRPLLRLRGILLRHLEALLLALGPAATPEDTAGIVAALADISRALPDDPPAAPAPRALPPTTPRATAPTPPAPPRSPSVVDLTRARNLRIAGDALIGVGFAALGVMVYGIIVHQDRRDRLDGLTASINAARQPPSLLELREGAQLHDSASIHRSLAISTGIAGAVVMATGVALHVTGQRRARALHLGADLTHPGLTLSGSF